MGEQKATVVDVVIPAFNEQDSIAKVIQDIPKNLVREVVVVNNNSIDNTLTNARDAGATVINERQQGYGNACLAGISYLKAKDNPPEIIVFLDADYSDHPDEMPQLVSPIVQGKAQMVIGSRALGKREKGAMMPQQLFGNWLATRLIKLLYGAKYSDLGPFRAIVFRDLIDLQMKDRTYGWTVEMQLKAARKGLSFVEVPVSYRKRIGVSKITGTLKGTVMAGYKIITTIFKYS